MCAKVRGIVRVLKARRRANDLKSLGRNSQPIPESPEQQPYLGACCAAIKVGFVKDDQKFLARILLQLVTRPVEDRSLDGAHEHVFEHRIIGY